MAAELPKFKNRATLKAMSLQKLNLTTHPLLDSRSHPERAGAGVKKQKSGELMLHEIRSAYPVGSHYLILEFETGE